MKVNSEELGPTKRKLQVEIPPPHVHEVVESLYNDLNKKAKIKGFRPGRTPRDILERYYGDYIKEKAISHLINETYPKAISQESIEPVAPPLIDTGEFAPERSFSYSAVVEVIPKIEVQGYKGLRLKGQKREEVAPAEVEEELERIRGLYSQLQKVEGRDRVQKGDILLVDFQGLLATRPIRDGKVENHIIEVGSGAMVPGFEESLIGKRVGVESEITVTFPPDHPRKDLAGKEIVFRVMAKEIRQKTLPPLDDEFARVVGDYNDLAGLRDKIRSDLHEIKERNSKEELRQQAIDQLLQQNPLEVPSYLVEQRTQELIQELKFRFATQRRGLPPEEEQALQNEYRTVAEKEVKASLLLEEIARHEEIEVTQSDVEERVREMARLYKRPLEELEQNLSLLAMVKRSLQRQKALDLLISEAEIKNER